MATTKRAGKKKTPVKKKVSAKKTPVKKKVSAKKTPVKKKVVAQKAPGKKATKRKPPMHASLTHPELVESEAERDETFEIFKSFDRDGSGSIDRGELARLLEALGQNLEEDELAVALEVVDANHSGRISWDEFKAWWSAR